MPEIRRERPALCKIEIHEGARPQITFAFSPEPEEPVKPVVIGDARMLRDAWQRAADALTVLGRDTPASGADPADLWKPLRGLLAAGRELGQRLADQRSQDWTRVQRAFTRALATRGQAGFRWNDIPVIDVVAHDDGYPVELLPAFLPPTGQRKDGIDNDLDLMRVAERFIGFSAVVRRYAPERQLGDATLPNDPTLPIQLFRYRELTFRGTVPEVGPGAGFAAEEAFLSTSRHVTVDGPWPIDQTEDEVRRAAVSALYDARRRLTDRVFPYPAAAVAHFACHCTAGSDITEFEVLLSTADGDPRPLTYLNLNDGYGDNDEDERDDDPQRAAVIFNACGSSVIDARSALSFQRWFLRNDHPVFLGTHAKIPDPVAADFAKLLYGFLLGGFTFGEAVVLARRQLLAVSKNPLGILYMLYGNDRLRVEVERPDALPKDFRRG